ncbi:hypothetical protein F5B18DRAFT_651055 [Nemania serpens]|nr:hypothetical protein F5B18DRAFT_651055 [Nemania serpens]
MSSTRTPLPTRRPVLGDDKNQNRVNQATSLGAKRTALPTARPVSINNDAVQHAVDTATRNLVMQSILDRTRSIRKSRQGGFDEVDPDQRPALSGVCGVVLKNGRYRCGICRNLMKNHKRQISTHNSKLHPRDPSKGSAYLRQIAKRPSPCDKCNKVCSSLEMLKQHIRYSHRETLAPKVVTPPVDGRSSDSDN